MCNIKIIRPVEGIRDKIVVLVRNENIIIYFVHFQIQLQLTMRIQQDAIAASPTKKINSQAFRFAATGTGMGKNEVRASKNKMWPVWPLLKKMYIIKLCGHFFSLFFVVWFAMKKKNANPKI